jgi:hypothetical protein
VGVVDAARETQAPKPVRGDSTRSLTPESRAAIILGNDAVVAARPTSPAQLTHACRAAGFDVVIPPSWGDELVAGEYLDRLPHCRDRVAIGCACPRVRDAVARAAVVPERSPRASCTIAIVAPPVAAARYLRSVYGPGVLVTYVGDCPSADDPGIDARFSPSGFFASLQRQGIALDAQPNDGSEADARRWQRYRSMPGGIPARRWLARPPVDRVLREVSAAAARTLQAPDDGRSNVLLDLADATGCVCGGTRAVVEECEPPRAMAPVVVAPPGLELSRLTSLSPLRPRPRAGEASGEAKLVETREVTSVASDATTSHRAAPATEREPRESHVPPAHALIAERRSRPIVPPGREARPAEVRPARQSLTARLPLLAVVVLAVAAALGGAVYAIASSAPTAPTWARGESATARERPSRDTATARDVDSRPSSESSRPAAVPNVDSSTRATSVDPQAARGDSAVRRPPPRRPPRQRRVEVVPGWLPQGAKTWTPPESTRTRRPDSTSARPRRDTVPGT